MHSIRSVTTVFLIALSACGTIGPDGSPESVRPAVGVVAHAPDGSKLLAIPVGQTLRPLVFFTYAAGDSVLLNGTQYWISQDSTIAKPTNNNGDIIGLRVGSTFIVMPYSYPKVGSDTLTVRVK